MREGYWVSGLERKTLREAEAGLLEAEEATANEHRSRLTGAEAEAQIRGLRRAIYGVYR